ncbi:RHS domain-containing protein [Aquabacterium sp. A7-Y]|uniref:RHS repeat-associated core domain-containing protein n=1 Tax=Aquabacterium sp. A7-Y TaxID=1349605 RepID=UPI00223D0812|nr:RHS repeat-associated core domain-containing protein [Aquabacterium sp. A7-Y]MCW7540674.1 RHS domain-containing protein [Aquabacterium sp. A7-Y]
MTEPTKTPAQAEQAPKREPQTAVAPLNTIAPEDLQASANEFDAWLRKKTDNYITLDRLTAVAGSLPVLGNIMALASAVMDVVHIVESYLKKKSADFFLWVSLGINVIGIVPTLGAVRMSLRPALHLVRSRFAAGAKNIGAAVLEVLAMDLADHISGSMEDFITQATQKLDGMLKECADWADKFADSLISVLQRSLGKEPLFKLNTPPPPPARVVYDPKTTSFFGEMMQSAKQMGRNAKHMAEVGMTHYGNAYKQVGNYVGAKGADLLPEKARATVQGLINTLQQTKAGFRASLTQLADPNVERSIMWLLQSILQAVAKRRKTRQVMMSADKGTQVRENIHGNKVEAVSKQAKPEGDPDICPLGPAPASTGKSISLVTGTESFTHTDFALQAPLPIEWSRTYRSNLQAFDDGSLGARWLTPFSTRIDVLGKGRQRALVYHGADGRSHRYPWLDVGQSHRDTIENRTLTRISPTLLWLDVGKPLPEGEPSPWRETYELVDTCKGKAQTLGDQHFRLVALQALHGAAIGLRYDHTLTEGPYAGEQVLSDILSKQGETTVAHVGVQPDAKTGRILGLWEIKDGQLVRQLAAYQYDEQGDLVQARDENGAAWDYQYQHHLVTRYTDRTGRGINLEYDGTEPTAKAIREWADDGSFDTRLEWDENIRLTYVTDALGQETWVYYDIKGYTYRVIHADKREEWFYRDDTKKITCHVHPDGSSEHFRYDEFGNLIQHTRADGSLVHIEYDKGHRITGILDPDGGVWKRDYDLQGRLSEETDPLGHKTQYGYDQAGRVTKVTDAKGGTKKLAYTASGQLARYTDCSGRTTQWTYDERDRLVKTADAAGHETAYRYTRLTPEALQQVYQPEDFGNHPGQLEAVVHPDESEEHFYHDAEGRLLKHTDALKRTTSYSYTATGLVHERIDALGQRLGYRWDKLGRLMELRNENDQPYSFRYDPVGRLLEETGFDGKRTEYRYEEATGVLAEVVEGPVTTKLELDAMGRLQKRTATAPGRDAQIETFAYYPGGRLGEAKNEHARLQWFYDEAGNLVREHHHYLGLFFPERRTAVWKHRYNELNQRIGTTRPDGHTLEWLTYGSGHIHGLVLDGEDMLSFERDALHREVYRQQGNGLEQHQKYDPLGRLLEQQVKHSQQPRPVDISEAYQQSHSNVGAQAGIIRRYRYDQAGQLDHIEDSRRGRLAYRYDPVGRLLQATSALAKETFAFDPAGNILTPSVEDREHRKAHGRPTLPKVLDNLLKEYAGSAYSYDERGNLIERVHNGQHSTFQWDAFNRMSQAVTPQGTTSFAYDPLGRRIAKRGQRAAEDGSVSGTARTTLYGWDGNSLAFESSADPQCGVTVHYIHEPGGFVPLLQARRSEIVQLAPTTDVKALMASNGGQYATELDPLWNGDFEGETVPFSKEEIVFYQCDHLGTPQELTDHEGNVAWAAQYKAWGQAKEVISEAARKAGFTNQIRFQGQYFDEETGLHYNRYRYYDPHSGRFASRDPIGLNGGNNLHAYAPNPIGWTDRLGLTPSTKSPTKVNDITILRKDIDLSAEDKYGHWWVELGRNESYGWWPSKGVSLTETVLGVPGDLNGQRRFGGTPTRDPHHGDRSRGVNVFDVYSNDNRSSEEIQNQVRDFAKKYNGQWSWPGGQNCHTFQEKMLKELNLTTKKRPK